MNYSNINDNPFQPYYGIPTEWNGVLGYNYATDDQLLKDGFRELKNPIHDPQTQYLGGIIKVQDYFTYEVIDFSEEELIERAKSLVPQEITPLQFNISMFQLFGISPDMILAKINTFPEEQRVVAYIYYTTASVFKRGNEMLNQFAPSMELTQGNLDQVFVLGITIE